MFPLHAGPPAPTIFTNPLPPTSQPKISTKSPKYQKFPQIESASRQDKKNYKVGGRGSRSTATACHRWTAPRSCSPGTVEARFGNICHEKKFKCFSGIKTVATSRKHFFP